jgi:hypothetical protein
MKMAIAEVTTRTTAPTSNNTLGFSILRSAITSAWPARPPDASDSGLVTV